MFVSGGSAGVPLAAGQAVTPLAGITARASTAGVGVTTAQGSAGDVASPTLVLPSALTPSSGTGHGLLGQYWNNGDFTGAPALTRVDQTIDLGTGTNDTAPPSAVAGGPWSAKWTGTLTPTESGLYRFTLSDAGLGTMHIAGQTFGPAYREATQFVTGPSYVVQGTVQLTAGESVPVEIDYSSRYVVFTQEVHFGWQTPSQSAIPAAVSAARRRRDRVRQRRPGRGHGPLFARAPRGPG